MPRNRAYSDRLLARVRRYFNIEQADLALYLGVSREAVAHAEAGRRSLNSTATEALRPLAMGVPDGLPLFIDNAAATAEPVPAAPLPAFEPLDARRDYCQHHAHQTRRALRAYAARAQYAARWRAALPALLATLPPAPDTPSADPTYAELHAAWRRGWLLGQPTELTPAEIAEWHLLRVRADALEGEAAALAAIIAAGTTPTPT